MADVFISYHPGSAGEVVRQIADALEANGISCWYANRDVYVGDFVGQITRAIRECRVFLLVLNQDALSSQYMKNELALGFRRIANHEKMTLLPFRVDNCDLKGNNDWLYYLKPVHIMDGAPPDKERVQELVKRVSRLTGYEKPVAEWRPSKQAAPRPVENL